MSRRLLVVTSVAAVSLSAAVYTGAADRFQMATGKELNTSVVAPGTVTCLGGEPAAPPMLCTPGTKQTHLRGQVVTAIYVDLAGEAAALIDGTNTILANCNLDESLQGPCWGTFRWEISAQGGQWEGAWSGQFDLANMVATYTAVGHGSGGALEGLQIKVDGTYPGGSPYGNIVVRIVTPGGR